MTMAGARSSASSAMVSHMLKCFAAISAAPSGTRPRTSIPNPAMCLRPKRTNRAHLLAAHIVACHGAISSGKHTTFRTIEMAANQIRNSAERR